MTNPQEKCRMIDISQRTEIEDFTDFDAFIPQVEVAPEKMAMVKELERKRKEKVGMDCMSEAIFNQVLEKCFEQGGYVGLRDALYLIVQANWGTRWSDSIIVKRIDFIDENGKFRESCLFSELKTGKPRTMYINDTIKMCVLMLLWNTKFAPLDYLIRSDANYKNYRKLYDENGKVVRINGKMQYEVDENGEKILEPLSYPRTRAVLIKRLVDDVGVPLKNVKGCTNGKFKYATHSLRKLYGNKIEQTFQEVYGDAGSAHTAAMEFLNWDLNHSSLATTSRYCGDFEAVKRELAMNINLGYDVVKKYFTIAKEKYLSKGEYNV